MWCHILAGSVAATKHSWEQAGEGVGDPSAMRTTGLLWPFMVSLQSVAMSSSFCRLHSIQAQNWEWSRRRTLLQQLESGLCAGGSGGMCSEQVAPNLSVWGGV